MSERDDRGMRPRLTWMVYGLLALLLAVAVAAAEASDRGREAEADWAPVTLLYMSDVKGKIEPCG